MFVIGFYPGTMVLCSDNPMANAECLQLATSRPSAARIWGLFYPQHRTFSPPLLTSAFDPQATLAVAKAPELLKSSAAVRRAVLGQRTANMVDSSGPAR